VLACVARWQERLRARLGTRLIYAADEFYLTARRPLPGAADYEGFPQQENGIGMARLFLDEAERISLSTSLPPGKVTLVTGTLAAPLLASFAAGLRTACGLQVEVIAARNQFYGGGVSVAGLLTGSDVCAALANRDLGRLVLLPATMLNADSVMLDEMTPVTLADALGTAIAFCAGPEQIVAAIKRRT
jgi:NifB/MoaA-like Fe-S oxidoreductase